VGIILTAVGEAAQVDCGSGLMVRDSQSGKHRRTRLFVLTLGCSRKSVRFPVWRSGARMGLISWIEGKHSGEKDSNELQIVDLRTEKTSVVPSSQSIVGGWWITQDTVK
jgi:hypothetical protein